MQVRERWSEFKARKASALVFIFAKPDALDDYQQYLKYCDPPHQSKEDYLENKDFLLIFAWRAFIEDEQPE